MMPATSLNWISVIKDDFLAKKWWKMWLFGWSTVQGKFSCGDGIVNCSIGKRNVLWKINMLTSSLTEQLVNGIFMFEGGRGLWILYEMNKASKDGQKVGHGIQMVYYLISTIHVQVLGIYWMIWC